MTNSWNIVSSKSKKYDSDKFLRVKPDCKLKVRLIGQPVKVVRVFSYDKKCISIDNEEMGKQLMQKHADKISNVSVRYACWCIDRNVNTMKVLDMPTSVARTFGSRAEIVGKKISSSKEGCDWAIGTIRHYNYCVIAEQLSLSIYICLLKILVDKWSVPFFYFPEKIF